MSETPADQPETRIATSDAGNGVQPDTDVIGAQLEALIALLEREDASSSPEYAGAIAAVLAARLEGTMLPGDVTRTLESLAASSQHPADPSPSSEVQP